MKYLVQALNEYYNNNKGRIRYTDPIPFDKLLHIAIRANELEEIDNINSHKEGY